MFKFLRRLLEVYSAESRYKSPIFEGLQNLERVVWVQYQLAVPVADRLQQYLQATCRYWSIDGYRIEDKYVGVSVPGNIETATFKIPTYQSVYLYRSVIPIKIAATRGDESIGYIRFIRGSVDLSRLLREASNWVLSKSDTKGDIVYFGRYAVSVHSGSDGQHYRLTTKDRSSSLTPSDSLQVFDSKNLAVYESDECLTHDKEELVLSSTRVDVFSKLFFGKDITEYILGLNNWLKQKDWILERGLPWTRGVLLYGPGGTGKSAAGKAIGMLYGIPVHQLLLAGMDEDHFIQAWEVIRSQAPAVALIEDFHAVFNGKDRVNQDSDLTFNTVLNTLSGVQDNTGIITVVTSNDITCLDPAFGGIADESTNLSTRPGRIDRVLYVGNMEDDGCKKLVDKILGHWPDLVESMYPLCRDKPAAQVQEICIQAALLRLHNTSDFN